VYHIPRRPYGVYVQDARTLELHRWSVNDVTVQHIGEQGKIKIYSLADTQSDYEYYALRIKPVEGVLKSNYYKIRERKGL
jgi:hypothetical protein